MFNGFDAMSMLPFVLIFGVFYFLILRPQQQKMKKHQALLSGLRRGDHVVTSGGLIGTVSKIVSDGEIQIEIAENTRVRLVRSMITEVLPKSNSAIPEQSPGTSSFSDKNEEMEPTLVSPKKKLSDGTKTKKMPASRSAGKLKK